MTPEDEKLCEELNLKKQKIKEQVDSVTSENLQFIKDHSEPELESLNTRLNNSLALLDKEIDKAINNIKNNFGYDGAVAKAFSDSIEEAIESIHKKQTEILSFEPKETNLEQPKTAELTPEIETPDDAAYPKPEPEEEPL